MPITNPIGVAGTDGVIPIYNPDNRWTVWSIDDVFTGGVGDNRYVPKLKDYVIDPSTYTTYRVEYIDPVTLIPTLNEIRPANMSFAMTETDVLFGVGPGTQADTYRVYLDTSVTPHILAVDTRLKIAGSLTDYAKIFKSSDVSSTGSVISKNYDANGTFLNDKVPLELVAIDSHNNYSIKTLSVTHTTEELDDGEIVTVVVYNAQGHVVSKRQLLVENTAFIRSINTSTKYISHISLDTAFLSTTDDKVINFPLNVPVNALNLMGVVHYSDGSTLRLPVNGGKFKMYGLDQYVSNIVGQTVDLVLSYTLANNETSYNNVSTNGNYITEPYSLRTVNPDNSYSVKLYGYPLWVNTAIGYQMQWYLLNLDRNIHFNVTQHVNFSQNTGPFDPKGYGYLQRKTVSINLSNVSGSFNNFLHVQEVEIVLNSIPDTDKTIDAWTVSLEPDVNHPTYGDGLYATKIDNNTISISSGFTSATDWYNRLYLETYPLINPVSETTPPTATHVVIETQGQEVEIAILDVLNDVTVPFTVNTLDTIFLRFIKKSGVEVQNLAYSALLVKQN